MKRIFIIAAAAAMLAGITANAKVKLPSVIGDHMVLQQQTDASIWGWADAGKKVSVRTSWDSKARYETLAGKDGRWSLKVSTPSYGGPYTMEISDGEKVTISDVMIGEVWVCSGQSNMEMPVSGWSNQPVEGSTEAIMKAGTYSDRIHLFTVGRASTPEPQQDCKGEWQQASIVSVPGCSAIAYFFAEYLTDILGMPVGLLISDWGGSSIDAWMPKDLEMSVASENSSNESVEARIARFDVYENHRVAHLYNGMITPVMGYTAKGFLWYQGCTNKGDITLYDRLQSAMVARWREDWGDSDNSMPFYYCTIAPFVYGDAQRFDRGYFVENQMHAAAITPNSDYVCTEAFSPVIDCIHPRQKKEVSRQFALLAASKTYGIKVGVEVGCPVFKEMAVKDDGEIELVFDNCPGGGLFTTDYTRNVKGIEVAGEDKVFHPAEARTRDNKILVKACPEVPNPVAVRYSFRNFDEANVVSRSGFPLPPFRTDDWNDVER